MTKPYGLPQPALNAVAHLRITTREFDRAITFLEDPELIRKLKAGNVLLKNMLKELEAA